MNVYRKLFYLLAILVPLATQAQDKTKTDNSTGRWYIGVQGGIPFGVTTFTSFGADKTRLGYTGGALVGYRINPLLSAEFSASFSRMKLGADKCCTNYWLAEDGMRYYAPVYGMKNYLYGDIYSSIDLQQYGLHLNIDLLQIFKQDAGRRFSVLLSPAVYGVGTKATIKTIANDETIQKGDGDFQFGYGGDLSVAYKITRNLGIRLSSGVNILTGDYFDGVPEGVHKENLVWNNNLSLTWCFGKKKKGGNIKSTTYVSQQQPEVNAADSPKTTDTPKQEPKQEPNQEPTQEPKVEIKQPIQPEDATKSAAQAAIEFPSIYFAFNSIKLEASERKKMMDIVRILKENPDVDIIIEGYADIRGDDAENKKISQWRAETVRYWLMRRGVSSSRILYKGMGVDQMNSDYPKARRADVKQKK